MAGADGCCLSKKAARKSKMACVEDVALPLTDCLYLVTVPVVFMDCNISRIAKKRRAQRRFGEQLPFFLHMQLGICPGCDCSRVACG